MSQCKYHANINRIQTALCDHNFIANEDNENIVFDNFELDFKQLDHLVIDNFKECEFLDKDVHSAIIKKINPNQGSIGTNEYTYSASWNKSNYYAVIHKVESEDNYSTTWSQTQYQAHINHADCDPI